MAEELPCLRAISCWSPIPFGDSQTTQSLWMIRSRYGLHIRRQQHIIPPNVPSQPEAPLDSFLDELEKKVDLPR